MHPMEVLRRPVVTEKSTLLLGLNKYVFEVAKDANKIQVKEAVEKAFDVHVRAVNVATVRGKMRRMGRNMGRNPDWKKAVVTLRAGERIAFFEGV